MPPTQTLEVPVHLRPEAIIPFQEGEEFRLELGRTSVVTAANGEIIPVRGHDCDVIVNASRVSSVQSVAVISQPGGRRISFVIKTNSERGREAAGWVADLLAGPGFDAHVLVRHPRTGDVLRTFEVTGCRLRELRDVAGADRGFVWFDAIGG